LYWGHCSVPRGVRSRQFDGHYGQYLDDAGITAKIKAAFAEDKWVKGRDISVRTDHGVVDLTGTVNSKDESDSRYGAGNEG